MPHDQRGRARDEAHAPRLAPGRERTIAARSAADPHSRRAAYRDQRYSAFTRPQLAGRAGTLPQVLAAAGDGMQPVPAGSVEPV